MSLAPEMVSGLLAHNSGQVNICGMNACPQYLLCTGGVEIGDQDFSRSDMFWVQVWVLTPAAVGVEGGLGNS